MIRYRFPGSPKHREPIAFVGLSDGNLTRLRAGLPIRVGAGDLLGLGVELVIYHGATEVDMTRELEDHGFMPPGSTDKARETMAGGGEFQTDG
jgi:hypothetical protein